MSNQDRQPQVNALVVLDEPLDELLRLPDTVAAARLNARLIVWEVVDRAQKRSYSEKVVIIGAFVARGLWRYLVDPDTGVHFSSLNAWLSCSDFTLSSRAVNFTAYRHAKALADVPREELAGVGKANIEVLTKLSTKLRNDPGVLEAARTMTQQQFLLKLEREAPEQHLEVKVDLKFSPVRSEAMVVEETIRWAIDHDIAGSRDEALVRMAQTALEDWKTVEAARA